MNMRERVARVLAVQFEHEHEDAWKTFLPAADTVLKELREPTVEMLSATIPFDDGNQRAIWIRMIDKAREE